VTGSEGTPRSRGAEILVIVGGGWWWLVMVVVAGVWRLVQWQRRLSL
jgi:hypothetical protein